MLLTAYMASTRGLAQGRGRGGELYAGGAAGGGDSRGVYSPVISL
jgi:hypothetical protein